MLLANSHLHSFTDVFASEFALELISSKATQPIVFAVILAYLCPCFGLISVHQYADEFKQRVWEH